MTRVGVFGAAGKMGSAVCRAVHEADGLDLVAAVDPFAAGRSVGEQVPGIDLAITDSPQALLDAGAEVVVDFTVLEAARANLDWCAANGVHAVVGTTGFSADDLERYAAAFGASEANALIAANFAIGAVLMMRFAEIAAPWFETAEIIELHHDAKADAPSGTAVVTAQRMAEASGEWAPDPTRTVIAEGARGGLVAGAIPVHSVRLRGLVAHQEVLFGTTGQSLSIRHDSYDRTSFMPGVMLAVRNVGDLGGLTLGIESLLGI